MNTLILTSFNFLELGHEPKLDTLYRMFHPCRIYVAWYGKPENPVDFNHPMIEGVIYHESMWETNSEVEKAFREQVPLSEEDDDVSKIFQIDMEAYSFEAFRHAVRRHEPSVGNYDHAFKDFVPLVIEDEILQKLMALEGFKKESILDLKPIVVGEEDRIGKHKDSILQARVFIGRMEGLGYKAALAAGVPSIVGVYTTNITLNEYGHPAVLAVPEEDTEQLLRKVQIALDHNPFPRYLNEGNARQGILGKALQHCRGFGLDVGSNQWPFPGALPCDIHNRDEQFAKGPFDFVFSSHCLEHIKDWETELKLWCDSIRKGGTLFLWLPHPCFKPWHPEGDWVKGGWHVWQPEPVRLVKWIMDNTTIDVTEYSVYPIYGSFYIVGTKK